MTQLELDCSRLWITWLFEIAGIEQASGSPKWRPVAMNLFLHIALQTLRADLRPIDHAILVHGDSLSG